MASLVAMNGESLVPSQPQQQLNLQQHPQLQPQLSQQLSQQQQQQQLLQQHRSILPRPPSAAPESADGPTSNAPKRQQVLVACAACQKRKSKCTGARPRCSLCELKDTDCVYDTRAGEARGAHLKRKVTELNSEINYLKGVVNTLRTASWEEAQDLLRRIQGTAELEEALKLISDSSLLLSFRKPSAEFDGNDAKEDALYTSPSPQSEAPKRKRAREDGHQQQPPPQQSHVPRKDPRMSIELLTSAENDHRHTTTKLVAANDPRYNSTKLVAAAALPYATGAYTFRPDMINYGSVASDETD